MDVLRLGLVGCGSMGMAHAQAVPGTGMGKVVAVYDPNPSSASTAAEACGARVAETYEQMLADDCDAVVLASPPVAHCEQAVRAAQAGKAVFVEKPMALDTAWCDRMIAAAKAAGVSLMVGQVLRLMEPHPTLLDWTRQGKYGRLLHAGIWRVNCAESYARYDGWRARRQTCGGYLFEVGVHELDMLCCLLGEPVEVHAAATYPEAQREIESTASVHVRFADGSAGTYLTGIGFSKSDYGLCLRYERATIHCADLGTPGPITVEPADGPATEHAITRPGSSTILESQMAAWIESVRRREQPPVAPADARRAVALAEAAYRSADSGRGVALS